MSDTTTAATERNVHRNMLGSLIVMLINLMFALKVTATPFEDYDINVVRTLVLIILFLLVLSGIMFRNATVAFRKLNQ